MSPLSHGYNSSQSRQFRKRPASSSPSHDPSQLAFEKSRSNEPAISNARRIASGQVKDFGGDFARTAASSSQRRLESSATDNFALDMPRPHVALEQVYQDKRQKAVSFIDEVVVGRTVHAKPKQGTTKPPTRTFSHMDERQDAFQSLLNCLLKLSDCVMDEDGIVEKVNELSYQQRKDAMQFGSDEAEKFIKILVQQDKIFRTGGTIYGI
jgi:hypothetical protein